MKTKQVWNYTGIVLAISFGLGILIHFNTIIFNPIIIARKAVKDIDFWFDSKLSINLRIPVPEKIIVSKAKVQEFKKWFGGK